MLLASGASKVLKAQSLTFAPTGRLDLADNKLIVAGQPLAAVEASVISGRNGGAWDGGGIVTSMASPLTTLAVASNRWGGDAYGLTEATAAFPRIFGRSTPPSNTGTNSTLGVWWPVP